MNISPDWFCLHSSDASILPAAQDAVPRTLNGLTVLLGSGLAVQGYGAPHVSGPEQRGAQRLADGGALPHAGGGVAEDGGAVEGEGGEVVAQVGVRSRDADGLGGLVGQARGRAEDRGQHASGHAAGVHLLELQEGLLVVWGGEGGHGSDRISQVLHFMTSSARSSRD